MDSQKNSSENQINYIITETEQSNKISQNTINAKESYQKDKLQRKDSEQYEERIFPDRPMTEFPVSISDIPENQINLNSISIPVEHLNENKESKVQRLSTTDSMQEFLEIPDYIPGYNYGESEEKEET